MKPVAPFIQLAPMEGVLDPILRGLLSEVGGLDRMVTEFVRVTDRLLPDHVFYRLAPELQNGGCTRQGTPVFVQLLGGQMGPMAENAARVVELGAPGVDLNFGCPAKTVNRHDGGAVLLRQPERLFQITKAVRDAVPAATPVTVKVRLGFDHKDFRAAIAQATDEAGAAQIVVHARTKTEMYTPPAHWHLVRDMRVNRKMPFVINGEIWNVAHYEAACAASGVTSAALGRGLVRDPLLAHRIRCGSALDLPEFDRLEFLEKFFDQTEAARGPGAAVARLKQILRYWSVEDPQSMIWFQELKVVSHRDAVMDFFRLQSQRHSNSRRRTLWPPLNSTLGHNVPFACAPKTC